MPSATFNLVNFKSTNRSDQIPNLYWREPGNAKLTGGDFSWIDDSSFTKPDTGQGVTPFLSAGQLENSSSIPNNAIIKGIVVTVRCRARLDNSVGLQTDFQFFTDQVNLIHSIDFTSANKSTYRTENWIKTDDTWFTFTYGSPTDTWGLNLTPTILKETGRSGLGVSISGWTSFTRIPVGGAG